MTIGLPDQIAWVRALRRLLFSARPGFPVRISQSEITTVGALRETLEGIDSRVSELLAANTAEVERRRDAERAARASPQLRPKMRPQNALGRSELGVHVAAMSSIQNRAMVTTIIRSASPRS